MHSIKRALNAANAAVFPFVVGKFKVYNVQSYRFPCYFESAARFRYLGMTLRNENCIYDEITSRFTSGNGCYCSAQILLSSRLLSKNIKIRTYINMILPIAFYVGVKPGFSH